jgi:DNA-binding beta-propeller fold protein YncE
MKHAAAHTPLLRHARASLAALLVLASAALAHAQTISAVPNKEGTGVTVEVSRAAADAKGVIELVNNETKAVVATLYAGAMKQMPKTTLTYAGHKPGVYTLRYRENLDLKFDTEIKRPDTADGKWVSPSDVKITPMGIYVYDAGKVEEAGAVNKPGGSIFKFNKDLSTDLAFGKGGALNVGYRPNITNFVVDEKGNLYLSSGSHHVAVYDWKGTPQTLRLGSTEVFLKDPKNLSTTWVNAVALGEDNKIYITSKSPLRVYDRTKNANTGFLYSAKDSQPMSWGPSITASGKSVYIADAKHQITKYNDDGKTLVKQYATAHKPTELIFGPTGLTLSGNLLWVAARGPGAGPFWDSGGGDEILLYWDNGTSLQLFQRYGTPGSAVDALQFHQPIGVGVSPDGSKLWVAEDGRGDVTGKTPQGSPLGNARVRVFDIRPKSTAETVISIK